MGKEEMEKFKKKGYIETGKRMLARIILFSLSKLLFLTGILPVNTTSELVPFGIDFPAFFSGPHNVSWEGCRHFSREPARSGKNYPRNELASLTKQTCRL